MENIIVRMRGGLGNQLFIYAYARSIQEKFKNADICLDLSEYKNYKLRSYDLEKFVLNPQVRELGVSKLSWLKNFNYLITRKIYHLLFYINKNYFKKNDKYLYTIFSKFGYLYNENEYYNISTIPDNKYIYIYGYYQNKKYADDIYKILVKELELKQKLNSEAENFEQKIKKSPNSIAVSIRCGDDYLKLGWPMCSIDYYKQGLKYIQSKFPDTEIYVFADEIEKVKKTFGFSDKVTYIENCAGYESLYLMSLCNHFVIANSTYSWWGAYLSQFEDKIVVAPKRWFKSKETKDTGLFSEKMVLLNN